MAQIFISFEKSDVGVAEQIATGLEAEGFVAWYYTRDSLPGVSYLDQTGEAVDKCQAVVLIISPRSVLSNQITLEVVRAHETQKKFLPVLLGISHEEFRSRRQEWRQALGAATSISVPEEGVPAIIPRMAAGLRAMGIAPAGSASAEAALLSGPPAPLAQGPRAASSVAPQKPSPSSFLSPWRWGAIAVAILASLLLMFAVFHQMSGAHAGRPGPPSSAAQPVPPPAGEASAPPSRLSVDMQILSTVKDLRFQYQRARDQLGRAASGGAAPVDFSAVRKNIDAIFQIDPANGHALYYAGELKRISDPALFDSQSCVIPQKLQESGASLDVFEQDFNRYVDNEKNLSGYEVKKDFDSEACYHLPQGYCAQRTAWIKHLLANDYYEEARLSKDPMERAQRLADAYEFALAANQYVQKETGQHGFRQCKSTTTLIAETKQAGRAAKKSPPR